MAVIEFIVGGALLIGAVLAKGSEVLEESQKSAKRNHTNVGDEIFNTVKSDVEKNYNEKKGQYENEYRKRLKALSKEQLQSMKNDSSLESWKKDIIDEVLRSK